MSAGTLRQVNRPDEMIEKDEKMDAWRRNDLAWPLKKSPHGFDKAFSGRYSTKAGECPGLR
jgi:hypothetical protein